MSGRPVVVVADDRSWQEMVIHGDVLRLAALPHHAVRWTPDQTIDARYDVIEYRASGLEDERGLDVFTRDGRELVPIDYPYAIYRRGKTAWASVWVSDLERYSARGLDLWDLAGPTLKALGDADTMWRPIGSPQMVERDPMMRANNYVVHAQALAPVAAQVGA